MPQINQAFSDTLHRLTNIAYRDGIACPLLVSLNDWALSQTRAGSERIGTGARRTTKNTATDDRWHVRAAKTGTVVGAGKLSQRRSQRRATTGNASAATAQPMAAAG